jgi:periplasmic divalent cation tolerance protein
LGYLKHRCTAIESEVQVLNIPTARKVQEQTVPADVVIVLTTLSAAADAGAFATTLVEERLAACVNVLAPMTSFYRWKGNVERDEERQVIIKTTRPVLDRLEARVRALHVYDTPEFLVLDVDGGGEAYLRWVAESATASAKAPCRLPPQL